MHVDLGVFYSSEGNYTRQESLQWPGPPEALSMYNITLPLTLFSICQPVHLLCRPFASYHLHPQCNPDIGPANTPCHHNASPTNSYLAQSVNRGAINWCSRDDIWNFDDSRLGNVSCCKTHPRVDSE